MRRAMIAVLLFLCGNVMAYADDAVTVSDMSKLQWQMDQSGKVWLWNLDHFDSSFLPCCYKYYIDTATQEGKTKWAAVLTHITTGAGMVIWVTNKAQVSPVTVLMNLPPL